MSKIIFAGGENQNQNKVLKDTKMHKKSVAALTHV